MRCTVEGDFLGVESRVSGEKTYVNCRVLVGNESVEIGLDEATKIMVKDYDRLDPVRFLCDVRSYAGKSGAYQRVRLLGVV